MPTALTVINAALTHLGLLEQGGEPNVSDSLYMLGLLQTTWEEWGIDESLIFAVHTTQFALTAEVGIYPYGPDAPAPFNVPRPSRVYKATFVTGIGTRVPVEIVTAAKYHSHRDQGALAVAPDEVYLDFDTAQGGGTSTLFLWPVPSVSGASLELETGTPFGTWAFNVEYQLPPGYESAIGWALAWRAIPGFGMAVNQLVAETVRLNAVRAEGRLQAMNAANRQEPGLVPQEQPAPAQRK